jgi:hypothetical protein
MNQDDEKEVVKRIPRRYKRRQKTNAPKPTTEHKEQTNNKPINLVIFSF